MIIIANNMKTMKIMKIMKIMKMNFPGNQSGISKSEQEQNYGTSICTSSGYSEPGTSSKIIQHCKFFFWN